MTIGGSRSNGKRQARLAVAAAAAICACLPGPPAGATATTTRPPPRISLSAPPEVTSGARVLGTGRIAGTGGGRVAIESRERGAWRALARGAVRNGRYRISFSLAGEGTATKIRALLLVGGRAVAHSRVERVWIRAAPVSEAVAPASLPAPPAISQPPSVPVDADYWGAWIGPQFTGTPAPEDMSAVGDFEQIAGKKLSLLETFGAFTQCAGSDCSHFNPFPVASLNAIRSYGAIPLFSWASEASSGEVSQPNFQLADVIAGTYDGYIQGWATAAKAWGHPFFLRFDWEMNGTWFPWSEGVNGNAAGEYVAAWRHVHDIFTSVGATNVSWVWCPYVNPNHNLQSAATLYPGDGYVDWTCLDGYNRGTEGGGKWRSFAFLFGPDYGEITTTIAPSKPMLLGEVASSEHGGSKAEWIGEMFQALPTAYPKVRGLMWFDYYDQGNDWPLETSPAAESAFAAGIAASRYLPNAFAALSASPIPVP